MVGCRLPSVLKYSAEAPKSSGLKEPWPWLSTSAWVCMSIATSESTSMASSFISDALRGGYGRHGDAVGLGLGPDSAGPGLGDGVRGPATVGVVGGLLLRVGPQRQLVAADADRLPRDVLRGVGGQE